MPTKLSRFCEAIMEAAWIVALIVAPVFFNIYSSRIFEPDKITLIRSLAIVVLFAWIIKTLEAGFSHSNRHSISLRTRILHFPMAIPVLALALVYLLATAFSVSPRVSLWGSYQRLQGFFTTFSYLVIFLSILGNLKRWEQIRRLITVAVLASIPVSLYGIIQRFRLDPIPWGGDVSVRVASNMGNSIFLAAFLIMVFPLTLVRIVETIEAMLNSKGNARGNFTRLTIYLFTAAVQLTTLFYTGSRGPWLGWAASMVFAWLGFALIWRKRWLSIAGISVAAVAAAFLVVLNIPGGPLNSLRETQEFGRLGRLLDAGSRTGRVRELIWQGAAELVLPHEPIQYPDGTLDRLNIFRPLIGYGPESMYVAYNPFYPPELTQVEKRNASPDRSHNETWDALVTSGVLGLLVYLLLFGSVIYYGSKWLGLIQTSAHKRLFIGLFLAGGLISSTIFVLWKGIPYLGVALPFGMVIGYIVYLIWMSLWGRYQAPVTGAEKIRAYILLGLLAAVLAHFVEINFGIAIVSTRTYFWVFTGLLLSAGHLLPLQGEMDRTPGAKAELPGISRAAGESENQGTRSNVEERAKRYPSKNRSVRKKTQAQLDRGRFTIFRLPMWIRSAMLAGAILAILLSSFGYLYITNTGRSNSASATIWTSLALSRAPDQGEGASGILLMLLSTGLLGMGLLVSEMDESTDKLDGNPGPRKNKIFWLGILVAVVLTLAFWFVHAGELVNLTRETADTVDEVISQVIQSEQLLTNFYIFLLIHLVLLAFSLVQDWPEKGLRKVLNLALAFGVGIVAIVMVVYSNLRVIQADMTFKTAEVFAQPTTWPVAIRIYERANQLAPNEDYYYLFLGRAYLEYARSLENPQDRDQLMAQAARDLRQAQAINPLNPDHTANLARLHSLWALSTEEAGKQLDRALISNEYFSRAVTLKPKDAKLWDEWALLNLNLLGDPEEAQNQLKTSLEIDPLYDWTYGLLGDFTERYQVQEYQPDSAEWRSALEKAAGYYEKALQYADANSSSLKHNYAISLAGIQTKLGQFEEAIQNYELALAISPRNPENWKILETLARLYLQIGDQASAVANAVSAYELAPDDQKSRLQDMVSELGG